MIAGRMWLAYAQMSQAGLRSSYTDAKNTIRMQPHYGRQELQRAKFYPGGLNRNLTFASLPDVEIVLAAL